MKGQGWVIMPVLGICHPGDRPRELCTILFHSNEDSISPSWRIPEIMPFPLQRRPRSKHGAQFLWVTVLKYCIVTSVFTQNKHTYFFHLPFLSCINHNSFLSLPFNHVELRLYEDVTTSTSKADVPPRPLWTLQNNPRVRGKEVSLSLIYPYSQWS